MERMSSGGSSIRRECNYDEDADRDSVSEAGDIGDRALPSRRLSSSFRYSFELSDHHTNSSSAVKPLPLSPLQLSPSPSLPAAAANVLHSQETKQEAAARKGLPECLDYISCMLHLAVFGILGVLTRYLLQKLFGPGVAGVTSDQTILYLDLPSNMVGSFLMGWFGVVFKPDIIQVSEHLAIAITTGYLGSLTTFSGWNQKMLELSASGHWLFAALGFFIGLFLVAFSIIFGIETAKGFKWLLNRLNIKSSGNDNSKINCTVDSRRRQLAVMALFLVVLAVLWGVCGALVKAKFKHGGSAAMLWFASMVGPVGVWIRWFLARLNGHGIGRAGLFKWIPFGTLIANISAACLMAALSSLKNAVNTRDCDTVVKGIQFGVLGCLSTVSTFVAEFNAMRESSQPWRAYAYAAITICASYGLGILIFCIPVWTRGFDIDT